MESFHTLLVSYDVGAWLAAVPLALALRRRPLPQQLGALALFGALLALAATFLVAAFVGNSFALLRLFTHAIACVLLPLLFAAGAIALRSKSGPRALAAIAVAAALAGEAVYVYAKRVEPTRLEVTHHVVRSARLNGLDGEITVAVLADIQTDRVGPYEERVLRTLDELRADLVVLPGDYVQVRDDPERLVAERRALDALFTRLEHDPPLGFWAVEGDVDYAEDVFGPGSRVRPLNDEYAELPEDCPIALLGLTLESSRTRLDEETRARIRAFDGLTLVVGHAPDFETDTALAWADGERTTLGPERLSIAGHVHGGQVVIPGFGPPVTLSSMPRAHVSGLSRFGPATLFVSRGIGHERGYAPRVRLNCRPELAVLHLRPESAR
ncbi:MAG: hypothetical protein AAFR54_03550 [Planctomycetota bacterium]